MQSFDAEAIATAKKHKQRALKKEEGGKHFTSVIDRFTRERAVQLDYLCNAKLPAPPRSRDQIIGGLGSLSEVGPHRGDDKMNTTARLCFLSGEPEDLVKAGLIDRRIQRQLGQHKRQHGTLSVHVQLNPSMSPRRRRQRRRASPKARAKPSPRVRPSRAGLFVLLSRGMVLRFIVRQWPPRLAPRQGMVKWLFLLSTRVIPQSYEPRNFGYQSHWLVSPA